MRKKLNQKVLITTLAASVLLGGGAIGLLQSDALADTVAPQTTEKAPGIGKNEAGRRDGGGIGKSPVKETAAILGVDEKTISDQLKAGQTLLQIAQAAGLTEASFLEKLLAAETTKINDELSSGKITQEQADKKKAQLTERLKVSISSAQPVGGDRGPGGKGQGGPGSGGPGGHGGGPGKGGGIGMGLFQSADALTEILGITKEELKAAQDAGKSIAEIAQEKGISEDALISKLKDGMTEQLKKFVESKREPRAEKSKPSAAPSSTTTPTPSASATSA
jgi:predicted transcriptional regulator